MAVGFVVCRTYGLSWILLVLASAGAWAQARPAELTLKQAFVAAWQRQPEAQSQVARQEAASAQREVANSWTPEPASLALSHKSDRLNSKLGSREDGAALAWPLWRPGASAESE